MKTNKVWENWNKNISHDYNDLHYPTTEAELVKIVRNAKKVRVVGRGHSTSDIAGGTETLINLKNYNKIVMIDEKNKQITVQSGILLADFLDKLHDLKWSLPCLPDIGQISLAGAISTGSHGTAKNGYILSQYMIHAKVVVASGELIKIENNTEQMDAFRVSLGLLGIFSEITLQCEKEHIFHHVEMPMKDDMWLEKFDEYAESNDFFRVRWLPHTDKGFVTFGNIVSDHKQIKSKSAPQHHKYRRGFSTWIYDKFSFYPRSFTYINKMLYLLFYSSNIVRVGNLYDTSVVKKRGKGESEITEWTVSRENFKPMFKDLKAKLESHDNQAYAHLPMDIRIITEDKTWLSYAYKQDTVTVGLACRIAHRSDEYEAFHLIEEVFLNYNGRPHWGKKFFVGKERLRSLWPKLDSFISLRREIDPDEKFLNKYLSNIFK